MKALFSALLFSIAVFCNAQYVGEQEVSIKTGEPYKVVDARSKHYFNVNGSLLSLKRQKKGIIAQTYDSERLKQLQFNVLTLPKDAVFEENLILNNNLYVFYALYNKSTQTEQLYCRAVNPQTGMWKGSQKKLVATSGKITGSLEIRGMGLSIKVVNKFGIMLSADKSKLVVRYRMKPETKIDSKSHDIIGLHVFDNDLEKVWGDDITMPHTERKMNVLDFAVNYEGTAYAVIKVFEGNDAGSDQGKKAEVNYNFHLLTIRSASDIENSIIEIEDYFIHNAWLYESPNNTMVLAGFYNLQNKNNVDGIFYANMDKDGEIDRVRTYPIPDEVLIQNEHKRVVKKTKRKSEKGANVAFGNLKLRNVSFDNDGSVTIIGEEYFVKSHTTNTGNGATTTSYTYHYNDMLVTKINPEGDLMWMKKLAKSQVGSNGRGTMSFRYYNHKNIDYFFYLDHEANKNLPQTEAPRTYGDGSLGNLVAYAIDKETGLVRKDYLIEMENVNGVKLYRFNPNQILILSETEFVFEAYKRKKEDILVKFTIEES